MSSLDVVEESMVPKRNFNGRPQTRYVVLSSTTSSEAVAPTTWPIYRISNLGPQAEQMGPAVNEPGSSQIISFLRAISRVWASSKVIDMMCSVAQSPV